LRIKSIIIVDIETRFSAFRFETTAMLHNRFADQMHEAFSGQAFASAPQLGPYMVLPLMLAGNPAMAWLYQQAFQAAQNEVQAARRSQWLTASLN
jgi:hypothetical protein